MTRIEVEAIVEVIVEVLAVTGRRLDIISVIGSDYTSTACSPQSPNSALPTPNYTFVALHCEWRESGGAVGKLPIVDILIVGLITQIISGDATD